MAELKPCPFCGGESLLLHNAKRKIYGKDEYRIGVVACCTVCEARMFYGSESLAIEAWNRRATIEPERKTGKWIVHEPFDCGKHNCNPCIECSCCKTWFGKDCYAKSNFCPNCGEKMEEGD